MNFLVRMLSLFGVKVLLPVAKWVGIEFILPYLAKAVTAFFASIKLYFKKKKALKDLEKKKIENAQRNENYENNPSDDSFGSSP